MRPISLYRRLGVSLVVLIVTTICVSGFLLRTGTHVGATDANCTGTAASVNCFHMTNLGDNGELGLFPASSDLDSARVRTTQVQDGTAKWALSASGTGSLVLKNLAAGGKCLSVPDYEDAPRQDSSLSDCDSASKFSLAPTDGVNVVRFVSVDHVGSCLRTDQPWPNTTWRLAALFPCSDGSAQQWRLSGPTSGTGADWPRATALNAAKDKCHATPRSCEFVKDNPTADAKLETRPAGCLKPAQFNTSATENVDQEVRYATTTQYSNSIGGYIDLKVGFERMKVSAVGGFFAGGSVTVEGYYDYKYTAAAVDTSTYKVSIPPKMYGWISEVDFVRNLSGTWTFDIGTSYEWSNHFAEYNVADVDPDHPYGHRVEVGVGLNPPDECRHPADPVRLVKSYAVQDRSGPLLTAFPYAVPANAASKGALVGFAFKTGSKALRVDELGRRHLPPVRVNGTAVSLCDTCSKDPLVALYSVDGIATNGTVKNGQLMLSTQADEHTGPMNPASYDWGAVYVGPAGNDCDAYCLTNTVLKPNTTYVLLTTEGYGSYFSQGTVTVDPTSEVVPLGPAMGTSSGNVTVYDDAPNLEWGGANLQFAVA